MLQGEGRPAGERIEELFDAVSELPPEERTGFLDAHLSVSSTSDASIRRQVERLLRHYDGTGVLDQTLINLASAEETDGAALTPGEIIAQRFQVIRLIGSGGMGEVYEAKDLAVGQTVALKTIRVDLAGDTEQTERFRRELLLSRSLTHRNVCRVFDYEHVERSGKGRLHFFTMELLRGETLAQRLVSQGRLSPDAALAILEQVAAGLDEVHRNGIIHRDMKPSNIFLVREADGGERAVVMDFGLARSLIELDLRQTSTGMILGTRLYIAPESSKSAGIPSDIFSFGIVALEMVTGSPSPIVAPCSIVRTLDPTWDKALLACFRLDPTARPTSALAVVGMLRRRTRLWRRSAFATLVFACLIAGITAWSRINSTRAPAFTRITSDPGLTIDAASSANGKLLSYASDRGSAGDLNIWVQNIETGETRQVTNDHENKGEPTLSGDGKLIAWRSGPEDTLYVRPIAGGNSSTLAKHALTPRFSPDGGHIAYWSGAEERYVPSQAWVVALSGGPPRNLAPGFFDARLPTWSPDGKSILFRGVLTKTPNIYADQDWWITALDGTYMRRTGIGPRLRAAHLEPHESPSLWDGSKLIFVAKSGHGINLFSMRFPFLLGFLTGTPQPLTTGAGYQDAPAALTDGRIAYVDWDDEVHLFRIDLGSSNVTQITNQESNDTRVSVSTNGQVLVFGRRLGSDRNVWTKDLRTGEERTLAVHELANPMVAPDGRTVAMSVGRSIRLIDVPTAHQTTVCGDCGDVRGWMPQAGELLYRENISGTVPAIRALDIKTNSKRTLLSAQGINEAAVSPDGNTLAFSIRTEGFHSAIFIAKVIHGTVKGPWSPATPGNQWADKPVWSPNGKMLYFTSKVDGFVCIWSQMVDTARLKIEGDPRPVRHFHKASFSLSGVTPSTANLAVGGGSLFFSVDEAKANIVAVQP